MDAGGPQRLVGVDVADAAHDGLVEQHALDRGVLARERRAEGGVAEGRVERIARDVGDLRGNRRGRRVPQPPGAASGVGISGSSASEPNVRWSAKHDGELAVLGMLDVEPHALVALGAARRASRSRICPLMPRWATSASVGAPPPSREREPQELAAPRGGDDAPAGERGLEVRPSPVVAGQRALVEHGDAEHGRAGDRGSEAGADDLDLGQLRHGA